MRKGTKAKIERKKRALERFHMIPHVNWEAAFRPNTNIKRFANEDAYAAYFACKIQEKAALTVRLRNAA